MKVRYGVLNKDTFLYFQVSEDDSDIPKELLVNKIANHRFSKLLRSIKLPAGSPVLANHVELKVVVSGLIVRIFKLNGNFFFTVYDKNGNQTMPRKIVFPNGAPPYPYPVSLIA